MGMSMGAWLAHALVFYTVLVSPWWGQYALRKALRELEARLPGFRLRWYRLILTEQVVIISTVIAIWQLGSVPAARLGLVAPASWSFTLGLMVAVSIGLIAPGLMLRRQAQKLRATPWVNLFVPESSLERRWYAAVSTGAGISEELWIRGFLIYYLSRYLPQLSVLEDAILTSIAFGLLHFYQGWKNIIATGILGGLLASLYLTTGSLVAPIVVHALLDLRLLLMFPLNRPAPVAAPGDA
jgi:membrane protease YdiL (CAAX protease family)